MKLTLEAQRLKGAPLKRVDFDEKLWKERFPSEPYTVDSDDFADYAPAYLLGTKLRSEVDDFDLHEGEIQKRWEKVKGKSRLAWDRAKDAVRSAWEFDEEESGDVTDASRSG